MKKILIALFALGALAPFANAYNEVDPWWFALGPLQFGTNPPDYQYHAHAPPAYYAPRYYPARYQYPQNTYSYAYAYSGNGYAYSSTGYYPAPSYSYAPRQSYGGPSDYCVQMLARGYYVC